MNDNKKQILKKIETLNVYLKTENMKINLVIVGSAFFILNNYLDRSTNDIDFLNNYYKKLENIFAKLSINNKVKTFENTFGEWDEDILISREYSLSHLKVYFLSLERMLVQKLFSEKRWEDFELTFLNNDIDQDKFLKTLKEVKGYSDPIFLHEFHVNKDRFCKLAIKKGWILSEIEALWN